MQPTITNQTAPTNPDQKLSPPAPLNPHRGRFLTLTAILLTIATIPYFLYTTLQHAALAPANLADRSWIIYGEYHGPDFIPTRHSYRLLRYFFTDFTVVQSRNGVIISESDIQFLASLPHLETLSLTEAPYDPDWLRHLAAHSNLQSLTLNHGSLSDANIAALATLPKLKQLNISGPITDQSLQHIAQHTNLTHLTLADTNITDAGLLHLAQLKRLTHLTIWESPVEGPGLQHLTSLPLTHLTLYNTLINDASAQLFTQLTALEQLSLHNAQVSDLTLEQLLKLPNLASLDISNTIIMGPYFTIPPSTAPLIKLELQNNPLSNQGLEKIAKIETLQELNIKNTHLNDDALTALHNHPSLTTLHLDRYRFSAQAVNQLTTQNPRITIQGQP